MNKHFKNLFTTKPNQSLAKSKTRLIGQQTEQFACEYLLKQKLTLLTKNYLCPRGEIDLIMRDQQSLVFVEVRYRKNINFGTPLESISSQKIKRIKTAIDHFIMTNNLSYLPCRIDVIGLHGNIEKPTIQWIKNVIIE